MITPAPVATPLLARALGDLLTKAGSRLIARLRRLKAVNSAFRDGRVISDKAVATALEDVRIILGRHGILTEQCAKFIDELSETGLADRMALIAISGTSNSGTLAAFDRLWRRHSDAFLALDSRDLESLFNKLSSMFRASILNNTDAENYFSRQSLAAIRELGVEEDRQIGQRFAPRNADGKPLTANELIQRMPWLEQRHDAVQSALTAIARATQPLYSHIRVEGPSTKSIEIPAEQIYVESSVNEVHFVVTDDNEELFKPNAYGDTEAVGEFLSRLNRAAIVGDPGGGKTTLVRMLCRTLCAAASEGSGPLPIFITLRKFYGARARESTLSLFEYILKELAEQTNGWSTEQLRLPVQNILEFGKAVIFFDGLDEIISVAQRRDFSVYVRQFCSHFPLCRYVVTSRKVDYRHVSIPGFPTYELAPFSDFQIREYVRLSALNVFHRPENEVDGAVSRFMDEVDRIAAEFKGNPLLLSLIVWLYNSTNRIPDDRAEIYRECSLLLFQRWDALREISADIPDPHRLLSLLAYLAHLMYLSPELQAGVTRRALHGAIKEFFVSDYSDNAIARAELAAEKFLEHLAGRAWVLRALGGDTYEFTHRTFMEYFFACYLNDEYLSLDALFDAIAPRILSSEWNVPIHLALQMAVSRKRHHSEHAVNRLIELHSTADKKARPTVVEFIGSATEYLQPPERSLELIARLITMEIDDDLTWRRLFTSVMRTSNEMRHSIYRGLGEGLGELVAANRADRISFILDWFKALVIIEDKTFPGPGGAQMPFPMDAVSSVVSTILERLKDKEGISAGATKARFDVSGEFSPDAVKHFGVRLWMSSSEGPLYRLDWRVADFAAMIHDFARLLVEGEPIEALKYARLAIAIIDSNLESTTPVAITRAAIVLPRGFDAIDFNALSEPVEVSSEVATGLCFALLAYDEMRPIAYRRVQPNARIPDLQHILSRWLPFVGPPQLTLFSDLAAGRRCLFQPVRSEHRTVWLNDVLR